MKIEKQISLAKRRLYQTWAVIKIFEENNYSAMQLLSMMLDTTIN
jgi:hypothetical protein